MKYKLVVSLIALISVISSKSVWGVEVISYYVNGVDTTRTNAIKSAILVKSETNVSDFGILYNSTRGLIADLMESASSVFNFDDFYKDIQLREVNSSIKSKEIWFRYRAHPNRTEKMDAVVFKYAEKYTQVLRAERDVNDFISGMRGLYMGIDQKVIQQIDEIVNFEKLVALVGAYFHKPETFDYFAQDTQKYLDINNMLIELNSEENYNKGINIIAHSQGNLFANRLLDAFNQPDRVKMFSVATPEHLVYGEPSVKGYVTLQEDIVACFFVDGYLYNITNFEQEIWDEVHEGQISFNGEFPRPSECLSLELISQNSKKYRFLNDDDEEEEDGDFFGHGFRTAYMYSDENGDSESKKIIVEKFQENYDYLSSKTIDELGHYGTGGYDYSGEIRALENLEYNDYSASEISLSSSTVERGEGFTVYVTQSYFGTQTDDELPSSRVGYFCSDDREWDSGDHYLDWDSSSLGSDDLSHNERETLTIPPSDCNTGYILAVANYDDRIEEDDKSNNVSYTRITIEEGSSSNQGDVYITDQSVEETVMRIGTEYKLRSRQCYEGDLTRSELGEVRMRYYLSDDQFYSSDDDYLGYDDSTIGSDDTCDIESLYWTPESSDAGVKFILFYADKGRDVEESDENNNVKFQAVAIY